MPDDLPPPSVEVLVTLVGSLRGELTAVRAELERARARIAELERARARIAELEARLAANSGDSSRPPSPDGLAKPVPKTRSLRGKTRHGPGGQPGHNGAALRRVERPDHEAPDEPGACGGCGRSLSDRPAVAIKRRQSFDLPPVRIEVTDRHLTSYLLT